MEEQMKGTHPCVYRWLSLLLVVMIMLACNFLQSPGVPATPTSKGLTSEATQAIPVSQDSTSEATQAVPNGPDPLDRLLELRSIQFDLTTLQSNGTSRSVQGEIDSTGNVHLKFHLPVIVPSDLPEHFNPSLKLPEESELYVVDGKAYQPDDQNPAWTTKPVADDYVKQLSDLLHGPDGPGLWLDFLPDGSLKPAGQETVGGFAADKYTVNGSVSNQTITGNLWYENHALVQVELHIPAALFNLDKPAAQGELKMTLEAQKANVSSIVLPAPPDGTAP